MNTSRNNDKNSISLGNKPVFNYLEKLAQLRSKKQSIGGSYIFAGPEFSGKKKVLQWFLLKLVCEKNFAEPCQECRQCKQLVSGSYADMYRVVSDEDKPVIGVDKIRRLIKGLNFSSFLHNYKIGIVDKAHLMSPSAANSLLKTLEEPKPNTIILLLTDELDSLPKTIISRSQILYFRPVSKSETYKHLVENHKASRVMAKNISSLAGGRPELAEKFLFNQDSRQKILNYAQVWLDFYDQTFWQRSDSASKLLAAKLSGQQGREMLVQAVSVWQSVARDLAMIKFGHNDLVQFMFLYDQLADKAPNINLKQISAWYKILGDASKYLRANVNPQLVLENILLNIKI